MLFSLATLCKIVCRQISTDTVYYRRKVRNKESINLECTAVVNVLRSEASTPALAFIFLVAVIRGFHMLSIRESDIFYTRVHVF